MASLTPEQIALIAEYGRDLILVLDEGHQILFTSPALQRQLGYAAGSWTGQSLLDFVSTENQIEVEGDANRVETILLE